MRLLATLLNECTAIHVQYEWLAGKRQTIEEGLTILHKVSIYMYSYNIHV